MLNNNMSEKAEDFIEIVGMENFEKVVKVFGGDSIYIPTYNSMLKSKRNDEIAKRFNGVNLQQLAHEYDISVNHARRIISNN